VSVGIDEGVGVPSSAPCPPPGRSPPWSSELDGDDVCVDREEFEEAEEDGSSDVRDDGTVETTEESSVRVASPGAAA
jgi:hypothetical protein